MWKICQRSVFLAVEMLTVYLLHEYLETTRFLPNVSLNGHSFPFYKYYILFQDSRMQKSNSQDLKIPFLLLLKMGLFGL